MSFTNTIFKILEEANILGTSKTKPIVNSIKNRNKISFYYTGPRKPASAAAPSFLGSVSPARYNATAADAEARNHVDAIALNFLSIMPPYGLGHPSSEASSLPYQQGILPFQQPMPSAFPTRETKDWCPYRALP